MTPDAREQARHIIETVQAYLDGKPIQQTPRGLANGWMPKYGDLWDWLNFEYRVKPEERKAREEKMLTNPKYPNEIRHLCQFASRENALSRGWIETIFREVLPSENTGS